MKRLGNLFALSALILTGCYDHYDGPRVSGNGEIVTVVRNIDDFEGIELESVANIIVNITDTPSGEMIITGESNIIPLLETKVRNGHLIIDHENRIRNIEEITIDIEAEAVSSIRLEGVGDIEVRGINLADYVEIDLSGTGEVSMDSNSEEINTYLSGVGDIYLTGITLNQKARISGTGTIDAFDLTSNKTVATVSGAGNIYVNVQHELRAEIDGTGSILYKGNPIAVNSKTTVAGEIRAVE